MLPLVCSSALLRLPWRSSSHDRLHQKPSFFFSSARTHAEVKSSVSAASLAAAKTHASPACRKSFTTSCHRETSPSAPPGDLTSNREEAKARAAEQAKMPHRSRQACSALRRRMVGSDLALALASNRTKVLVSCDHRPPTRQPGRRGEHW